MEFKYFVVRPTINGFETVMIMHGRESDIKRYIEYSLRIPCTYDAINEGFAKNLFDIGFKVYMCPCLSIEETIPVQVEENKDAENV